MQVVRGAGLLSLLFLCLSVPAPAQQADTTAIMMWGRAKFVRYHIVGVYQARTDVIGDPNWIGYADVTDRVVIDLNWKLTDATLVGRPTILNEKSVLKNLRNYQPGCLPPVLKGEYEHFELLEIKEGLGGALEMLARTSYPAADVIQSCSGTPKPVPASVDTRPEDFVVPSPMLMTMPLSDSDNLRLSPDKKSMIVKKDGWTWTYTPTAEPNK